MLTDAAVKSAKAGSKVYKEADSGGLDLFVPNGSRSWRVDYRRPGGGRNILSFSAYPDVSLKTARKGRDEACRLLAAGIA